MKTQPETSQKATQSFINASNNIYTYPTINHIASLWEHHGRFPSLFYIVVERSNKITMTAAITKMKNQSNINDNTTRNIKESYTIIHNK